MTDCEYWKGIITKFSILTDANWAAHVLASHKENLSEARKCVPDGEIIGAVISAYGDGDWLTQSYCDEILLQFEREAVEQIYGRMDIKSDNVRQGIERFLTL